MVGQPDTLGQLHDEEVQDLKEEVPIYGPRKGGIGSAEPEIEQELFTLEERQIAKLLGASCLPDLFLGPFVAGVAFFHWWSANGVALLCLGLQAIAHAISSVLLIARLIGEYRFAKERSVLNIGLLREKRIRDLQRERRFSLLMAAVLLFTSVFLLFKALTKIQKGIDWLKVYSNQHEAIAFARKFLTAYGVVMYISHAAARWYCYKRLQARVVLEGFIVSFISVLFLSVHPIVVIAAGESLQASDHWWKAEPAAALILAAATFLEAMYIITRYMKDAAGTLQYSARG